MSYVTALIENRLAVSVDQMPAGFTTGNDPSIMLIIRFAPKRIKIKIQLR